MKIKIKATHPAELRSLNSTFLRPIEMEVEAEKIGDVLVYKSPASGYWIARNEESGYVTNSADRDAAIADASQQTLSA